MIPNIPAFVSNDDNIYLVQLDTNSGIIHLLVHIEKARESVPSAGNALRLMLHPMGGLEYSGFKILLSIRIFQREIILLVLKNLVGLQFSLISNSKISVLFWISEERFFSDYICQEMW